jgi:hypothetical protein
VRPAILARAPRKSPKAPIGTSRLGGDPDLPPELEWPRWRGVPIPFVAQIDLAELPSIAGRELLPPSGRLWFFHAMDCDDDDPIPSTNTGDWAGCAPVLYSEAAGALLRRTSRPSAGLRYDPLGLKFSVIEDAPESSHPALLALGYEDPKLQSRYADVVHGHGPDLGDAAHNQILGWPAAMQNPVCQDIQGDLVGAFKNHEKRTEREDAALWRGVKKGALAWELLLQVDTQDDKNGMIWGDCGRIYWMMRRADLAERRFDRAGFDLQC